MPKYILSEDWVPADGFELEDNALTTVKEEENRIIIAGPGAGKTELLAQRACYLLQTNICPAPKQILAISFKRDAAFNLAQRVEKRVGKVLSRRFISLTFDAFSKGLVDRFRNGLPDFYKPKADYKIETAPAPTVIIDYFEKYSPGSTKAPKSAERREKQKNCMRSLTNDSYPVHSSETVVLNVLKEMLKSEQNPVLTFPVLSRLAQLLLNTNSYISQYLLQTYSHIFLDEFQDTTRLQYDLLKTAFLGSNNIVTAVGDTKQRIMLWAGAMDGILGTFKNDFSAKDLPLLMNFRSAPRLIKLQNHLAKELMGSDVECIPGKDRDEDEGIAEFWFFDDFTQEASIISKEIRKMVVDEGLDPREICLIYKQRPDLYAEQLQSELRNKGVYARVENELQDLLVEPVIQFLICFIYSAFSNDVLDERNFLLREYSRFKKVYDDESFLKLERDIIRKLKKFKKECLGTSNWDQVEKMIRDEIEDISFAVFKSYYPQYNEQTFFDQCINKFLKAIKKGYEENPDLLDATEKFAGKGCLPIMTIHKSKGLEFSVVFFIGFEDQNFWSYQAQPEEDTCSFFVALSRAKEAVYFTFSRRRINNFGNSEIRSIDSISPISNSLGSSQIVEVKNFRTPTS
ncbi:UvrD-helicase domain-containing protein [Phaeodactylibacter xiamenensis]|uniref:UvrD-helicase domain-containing protein n=1 Tax=Phaeodactylibacter xiamenensis TaxID=1524460 RepID=UPI0024A94F7F|nr:ATP-dependent helicase [Phaeodactylibacter xiamenensis]